MSKLTGKEIIEKIEELEIEPYEFEELNGFEHGLGDIEMVADESFTNGDAYRVMHFKDHDVYIRQNGYYDSYESYAKYEEHDYDEVVPFERTITDYKKVDE